MWPTKAFLRQNVFTASVSASCLDVEGCAALMRTATRESAPVGYEVTTPVNLVKDTLHWLQNPFFSSIVCTENSVHIANVSNQILLEQRLFFLLTVNFIRLICYFLASVTYKSKSRSRAFLLLLVDNSLLFFTVPWWGWLTVFTNLG